DVVRPTKLPSFENQYGDDGSWFSSVRQSRLGVSSSVPTQYGDLKTIFEFELFGVGADAGQTTFRLRHAWGELGQFGAGQYWSTFMDIDVFPNSIEYWGPSGMIFYRNIQARWTPWSTDSGSRFAISLEQPGASGDEGRFADRVELDGLQGDFEVPDLAAHYRHQADWGHVQAAGILRQIQWVDTQDDGIDLGGDEVGWGVNLSTNVNLGPHVFRGSLTYGEGISNYFNDGSADVGIAFNPDGQLPIQGELISTLGLVAFLDLNWSDRWTSTVGYSLQDNDLPDGSAETSFERGQYALANLLYHPVPNVLLGPELQWAKRDNFGPFSSDDFRVQFSAKWNFNYLISGN
ncbi:MAG: DcaP family trimeric outer membrane transporter, partial [Pseudomonadota bacterium]